MTRHAKLLGLLTALMLPGCAEDDGRKGARGEPVSDADTDPDDPTGPDTPTTWNCELTGPFVQDFEFFDFEFQGYAAFRHFLEDPAGLAFVFHQGHSNLSGIQTNEWTPFYNFLNARGVAIVAAKSTGETWDITDLDPETNIDFPRLADLYQEIIDTTDVTPETPLVVVGGSNGGWYAGTFSVIAEQLGWPVRVTVHHNAAPNLVTDLPAVYWTGVNDQHVPTETVVAAYEAHPNDQKVLFEHQDVVLDPAYFTRHAAFDAALSQEHFERILGLGGIDEDGVRAIPEHEIGPFLRQYKKIEDPRRAGQAARMMKSAWARHNYHSEYACEEVEFVDMVALRPR